MKAIIYAGIGLFSAASIYGMADYYSSEKKGSLKNLYKEAPAAREISFGASEERDIELKDYSRGRIDEPVEGKKITAASGQKIMESNNGIPLKKKSYKRKAPKIRLSDFSRSALVIKKLPPVVVTDSSIGKY